MLTLPISAAVFVALSACAGVARFLNLQGSTPGIDTQFAHFCGLGSGNTALVLSRGER